MSTVASILHRFSLFLSVCKCTILVTTLEHRGESWQEWVNNCWIIATVSCKAELSRETAGVLKLLRLQTPVDRIPPVDRAPPVKRSVNMKMKADSWWEGTQDEMKADTAD